MQIICKFIGFPLDSPRVLAGARADANANADTAAAPGLKSLNGMRLSQLIIFYELNFFLIGIMPQIASEAMGPVAKMIDACAEMSHGKHET